jgi:hypothetical protein
MPRVKRRAIARRDWQQEHLDQLRCGWDYFGCDWGNPVALPPERRHEWPSPDVLADMRACWAAHGDAVKQAQADQNPNKPAWGELVFERGLTPWQALGVNPNEEE